MENKFTPEMIAKAKKAKNAEELLVIAKEAGIENLSAEEACAYFEQLNPKMGEIGDDDLDNVAGGGCEGASSATPKFPVGTSVTYRRGTYKPAMKVVEISLNHIYNCLVYTLRIDCDGQIIPSRREGELTKRLYNKSWGK